MGANRAQASRLVDLPRLLGEPPAFPLSRIIAKPPEYVECQDQALELEWARWERQQSNFADVATRADVWERCWRERLEAYKASGSVADLLPDFLRAAKPPLRYFGKYIIPGSPSDLHTVQKCILSHLLVKWMRGGVLLEFGCGSGYNLALARQLLNPDDEICGADKSSAAVECVKALGFHGTTFDMSSPADLSLPPWSDTTVLTAGAMEQIGDNCGAFLGFLLEKRPRMCIHIEPLYELYAPTDPFDAEAMAYHNARGYLRGFLPALQCLEREGRVQIFETHRTHFGGRFNDGFSWIVWRPK